MKSKPDLIDYSALSRAQLLHMYHDGLTGLDARILTLTDSQVTLEFPQGSEFGEWSCNTLIGHLADAELAFSHRMRRVVGEDSPAFTIWDETSFINAGLYRKQLVAESYSVVTSTRKWTASWLDSLPETAFQRLGLHPERGQQTLKDILAYAAWHLDHHAVFLDKKIDRLLNAM